MLEAHRIRIQVPAPGVPSLPHAISARSRCSHGSSSAEQPELTGIEVAVKLLASAGALACGVRRPADQRCVASSCRRLDVEVGSAAGASAGVNCELAAASCAAAASDGAQVSDFRATRGRPPIPREGVSSGRRRRRPGPPPTHPAAPSGVSTLAPSGFGNRGSPDSRFGTGIGVLMAPGGRGPRGLPRSI